MDDAIAGAAAPSGAAAHNGGDGGMNMPVRIRKVAFAPCHGSPHGTAFAAIFIGASTDRLTPGRPILAIRHTGALARHGRPSHGPACEVAPATDDIRQPAFNEINALTCAVVSSPEPAGGDRVA